MSDDTTTNIDGQGPDGQTDPEPVPPRWEENRVVGVWAIVEIMGHKVRAGSISDALIGGATMLRIQHPTVPGPGDTEPLTEFYASGALFSVRPCTRQTASEWAEARWRSARPSLAIGELEAVPAELVDDEDYDWD